MWRIYPSEIFFKPEPQKNAEKGEWERGRRSEEETRRERGELRIFVGFCCSPLSRRVSSCTEVSVEIYAAKYDGKSRHIKNKTTATPC